MLVFGIANSLWFRKITCVPTGIAVFILWSICYSKSLHIQFIKILIIHFYPWLTIEIWCAT